MELSIDTATDWASLALSHEGEVRVELSWRCGQRHVSELFPNLRRLYAVVGVQPKDLTAINVARGPGSFNGVRVGVSAAKGLALALGLPVAGVDTLEIDASAYSECGFPICALQEAGRGELAAALFRGGPDGWRRLWETQLVRPEELARKIRRRTLFCGHISAETETVLRALGARALIVQGHLRRAGYLARLGWERHRQGLGEDAAAVQPLYLRQPAITERRAP